MRLISLPTAGPHEGVAYGIDCQLGRHQLSRAHARLSRTLLCSLSPSSLNSISSDLDRISRSTSFSHPSSRSRLSSVSSDSDLDLIAKTDLNLNLAACSCALSVYVLLCSCALALLVARLGPGRGPSRLAAQFKCRVTAQFKCRVTAQFK